MYEQLYRKAVSEDADVVLCDLWYHYTKDPIIYYGKEAPNELTSRSVLSSCLCAELPRLNSSLWNKLIKSRYYDNVEWPYNVSFCEDMIILSQILCGSQKISYLNHALYHWRLRSSSLSHREYTRQSAEKDRNAINILHRHLCASNDADLYRCWQAYISLFLIETLKGPKKIFSNQEYASLYRKYRNCIWKNRIYSRGKKILLYIATYNYSIAFALGQSSKQLKAFLRRSS